MPRDPKLLGQATNSSTPPPSKELSDPLAMGMAAATGAGSLEEGENENEQSQLVATSPIQPESSAIFLRTKLSSTSPVPFGYASTTICPKAGGRLYRVHVHAPHGVTVLFSCNNAPVKVSQPPAPGWHEA